MKKAATFIFSILLGFIVASNATLVFAAYGNTSTYLPYEQVWMQSVVDLYRTGDYSHVFLHVYSVYPMFGTDNYTKCKFALYHPTTPNLRISSISTYTEGNDYTKNINEGYLSLSYVDICVSGNKPDKDGYVYYYYWGR